MELRSKGLEKGGAKELFLNFDYGGEKGIVLMSLTVRPTRWGSSALRGIERVRKGLYSAPGWAGFRRVHHQVKGIRVFAKKEKKKTGAFNHGSNGWESSRLFWGGRHSEKGMMMKEPSSSEEIGGVGEGVKSIVRATSRLRQEGGGKDWAGWTT